MTGKEEARGAVGRTRASERVARQTDASAIAPTPTAVHHLARRLGVSVELAALLAELAALGPREARS